MRHRHRRSSIAQFRSRLSGRGSPNEQQSPLSFASVSRLTPLNTDSGTTSPDLWPAAIRPTATLEVGNTDDWPAAIASGRAVGVTAAATAGIHPHPGVTYRALTDAPPVPLLLTFTDPAATRWSRSSPPSSARSSTALGRPQQAEPIGDPNIPAPPLRHERRPCRPQEIRTTNKARVVDLSLCRGAGDENRTRALSLGIWASSDAYAQVSRCLRLIGWREASCCCCPLSPVGYRPDWCGSGAAMPWCGRAGCMSPGRGAASTVG
jgi:hypothetical protein